MDTLGQRMIRDKREIQFRRDKASMLEDEARRLRIEADEIERLLELARLDYR